jgi:hypothetical protein
MSTSQVIRLVTLVLAALQTALAVRKLSAKGPGGTDASMGLTPTTGNSWERTEPARDH